MKHGGGDGDAGRAVGPAAGEQPKLAAAEVGALLVVGVPDARGRPHGAEGAVEAGVELAVGLRDLLLHDRGRQQHPQPGLRAPVEQAYPTHQPINAWSPCPDRNQGCQATTPHRTPRDSNATHASSAFAWRPHSLRAAVGPVETQGTRGCVVALLPAAKKRVPKVAVMVRGKLWTYRSLRPCHCWWSTALAQPQPL